MAAPVEGLELLGIQGMNRVPKGEFWVDMATKAELKGGWFISKIKNAAGKYLKFGKRNLELFR